MSSSSKFLEQQQFFEPTAIPRKNSTSPLSTCKAPVQQIRPQPTLTAVHQTSVQQQTRSKQTPTDHPTTDDDTTCTTVPTQQIRPQTTTKSLHPEHDDDKSYSTGLPVLHRMKYSNTLQYRQPTSQRPSTVPCIKDDPFFEIHHPIYRHIGPRRYRILIKAHPTYCFVAMPSTFYTLRWAAHTPSKSHTCPLVRRAKRTAEGLLPRNKCREDREETC